MVESMMPDEASAMLFKNDAPLPRFVEQGKAADFAAGSRKKRKPIIFFCFFFLAATVSVECGLFSAVDLNR